MCNDNLLILAAAGSGKTQGLVDSCASAGRGERVLILTYTRNNQAELRRRLALCAGDHYQVEVRGWFSFLIGSFVRPFLPLLFEGLRVRGFDFDSPPQVYARVEQWERYFNPDGQVRKVHLPQLAVRVESASGGAGIRRLERLYDRILIDEVQDLCGYDLEVLTLLMRSAIPIEMVGDIRQAILATNERERKHKKFMYMNIWHWFKSEQKAGRLSIVQRRETRRCNPTIASFADSLFDESWGFEQTISMNKRTTDHDGMFLVRRNDVDEYVSRFSPLVLRYSSASSRKLSHLQFMNIGEAKGLEHDHVMILPTEAMAKFLQKGVPLNPRQAAHFYVAATRARQSVAIILDKAGKCQYPFWKASQ